MGRMRASRRPVALAATGLLIMSLTACGSDGGDGSTKVSSDAKYPDIAKMVPDEIREKGTFKIPMDGDYPPEHFLDDGKLTGFNPEFAAALGEVLDLDFEPTVTSFDSIIPGMQAGRYDIAIVDVFVTEEREQVVDFVTYLNTGSALLATAENPHNITDLASVCGLRAAILKGTAAIEDVEQQNDKCENEGKDPAQIDIYGRQGDATLALLSGQADFVAMNSPAAGYAAKQNPELSVTDQYVGFKGGIIIPKDERDFAEALKAGVDKLIEDGTYAKLLDKWGMTTAGIDEAEILPEE